MRLLRNGLLAGALLALPVAVTTTSDARASVSIAVALDALVKDADAVGVVTPVESMSVWEDGRIYTYTRVKVDQGVAGDLGTGGEGWVRTMGGVVGKIGQMVDGEPVLLNGKSSLLFLHKFKAGGTYEVSARAQGQYPILVEESANVRVKKVVRSANVGVLFPPKTQVTAQAGEASKAATGQAAATTSVQAETPKLRLAGEVLHDRPLDDVAREIATHWKRLHAAPAPAK